MPDGAPVSPIDGLALDFTGSGVERLPQQLLDQTPTHFLVANDATPALWSARVGADFNVVAPAALEVGLPGPFADPGRVLSHAGAATFSADSVWADTRPGALALEVVFRGEPEATLLSQQDANAGLELLLDATGTLNLRLEAGAALVVASSQALVPDTWHHCLVLFDLSQSASQIICNGQAGVVATVPSGFSVGPITAPATLGATPARLHWAQIARWEAATWGPRGAWTDLARERFARLVGTYAHGAMEPLPFAEVRASGAYLDMTPSDAPELRRLHPVGEHWPRIVCRPTNDSARVCGLLVEVASSQPIAPQDFTLDNWAPSEVAVTAQAALGPTEQSTLYGITPSAMMAEHALELDVPMGEGPAVLSFFARSAGARLVRAEVVGVADATFDLVDLAVTDSAGTLVAGVESWGDGLVRLSYAFDVNAGPGTLRIALLADDGMPVFAGSAAVAAQLGNVELRFRSYSTPLPTFGAIQQADHLVYPAGNGNFPSGPFFSFSAEIWLPDTPLVSDAAVLNANFAARYDQQINLFVRPQDGTVQFWGLQGNTTPWQFSHPQPVTDGALHQIVAALGAAGATLSVDDQSITEPTGQYDISVLDRIEIGTSTSSSGPLTGMVRSIRLAPPQ